MHQSLDLKLPENSILFFFRNYLRKNLDLTFSGKFDRFLFFGKRLHECLNLMLSEILILFFFRNFIWKNWGHKLSENFDRFLFSEKNLNESLDLTLSQLLILFVIRNHQRFLEKLIFLFFSEIVGMKA